MRYEPNDVQVQLRDLRAKGWTLASIAEEMGTHWTAVYKWQAGERYPRNVRPVLVALRALAGRRRVPKRHRSKSKA